MGLFDKKQCAICGKQYGLLGGTEIADGHLCNDCRHKFSPYASGIKKMTTEDVKRHLAYREKNQVLLSSFNPSVVIGTDEKFYFDESKGNFIITRKTNWRDANPDIVSRSQVVNAAYNVHEKASEIYKDEEKKESYNPKKYEYEYTFTMNISVDSPYFKEISFEVEEKEMPEVRNDAAYKKLEYDCRMIQHLVQPNLYPKPEEAAEVIPLTATDVWTCSCGQEGNTGKFCSACGKEKPADLWDCPSCGQKGNTGRFCIGCGKEKPESSKWFCPDCGQENTGRFCSACGKEKPANVGVRKITPLVKKPGLK